jgi:anti-sigma regulatory factor (Ser/Thr protein kinase)
VLWEWGLNGQADTVELVVSELVTNAVRASEGIALGVPVVRLWLRSDRHCVVVQVWDGSERMPVRQDPEVDAESGRGLMLVETLSAECGTYRPARFRGKVTWAVMAA